MDISQEQKTQLLLKKQTPTTHIFFITLIIHVKYHCETSVTSSNYYSITIISVQLFLLLFTVVMLLLLIYLNHLYIYC